MPRFECCIIDYHQPSFCETSDDRIAECAKRYVRWTIDLFLPHVVIPEDSCCLPCDLLYVIKQYAFELPIELHVGHIFYQREDGCGCDDITHALFLESIEQVRTMFETNLDHCFPKTTMSFQCSCQKKCMDDHNVIGCEKLEWTFQDVKNFSRCSRCCPSTSFVFESCESTY
jgi:hypothetical protein